MQFEATHGLSKEPMFSRWKNLRSYAKKNNLLFEWQEYPQFKESIGINYKEGARLVRIDKSKGFTQDNVEWKLKKPSVARKHAKRKSIKPPSEYSPNWIGF